MDLWWSFSATTVETCAGSDQWTVTYLNIHSRLYCRMGVWRVTRSLALADKPQRKTKGPRQSQLTGEEDIEQPDLMTVLTGIEANQTTLLPEFVGLVRDDLWEHTVWILTSETQELRQDLKSMEQRLKVSGTIVTIVTRNARHVSPTPCEPVPVWARSCEPAVLPARAKARHVSPIILH